MRSVLLTLCLAATLPAASLTGGDDIVGTWEIAYREEVVHVEISRAGEIFSGTIVWIENEFFPPDDPKGMAGQPKVDRNNPDPALRTRPIVGIAILGDLRYSGNREWNGGWIYPPDRGRKAHCKLELKSQDTLHVRGFVGLPLFGRTVVWRRVDSNN